MVPVEYAKVKSEVMWAAHKRRRACLARNLEPKLKHTYLWKMLFLSSLWYLFCTACPVHFCKWTIYKILKAFFKNRKLFSKVSKVDCTYHGHIFLDWTILDYSIFENLWTMMGREGSSPRLSIFGNKLSTLFSKLPFKLP